jgi:hypothetical protein
MKHLALFTAAALAVGGFINVGCDRDETSSNSTYSKETTSSEKTAGEKTKAAGERAADAVGNAVDKTVEATKEGTQKAGDKLADAADRTGDKLREVAGDAKEAGARIGDRDGAAPDAEGIRDVLASVTEAALTEGGLDDLTERLVDADRNRIGKAIEGDFPDHAALVKQFRADWKAKYNEDFDLKEDKAYPESMFSIRQGEVGAAAPSGTEVATGKAEGSVDTNVEKGRNIAAVSIAESHGMPGVEVSLIHELPDAWRIDVPDSVDAAKLKDNIVKHLQAAHDMKAQWPDNIQDAYAAVTHHVVMALLDKPVK